jgi:hypothetical protein
MDPFVIKSVLSVLLGIIWVSMTTLVAERVSGKLGGLIAGLPSTAVISLLFIGLTQPLDVTVSTSSVIPFSTGVYCFFFLSYLYFSKKSFAKGMIAGLITWFFFAYVAHELAPSNIYISILIWLVLDTISIYVALKYLKIDKSKIPERINKTPIWLKVLISGFTMTGVILISLLAGPRWGIVFVTFPAITTSTFLITIKSGGVEFTRQVALNILISTTVTIGIFAILAHFIMPLTGAVVGIVLAYILLIGIAYFLYRTVFDKLKQ